MATIMQKDVLIEVVAYTQAIIIKRTAPDAPRNEDQRFLSNLRDYIYSTAPDKIDYQKTLDDVKISGINTKIYLFIATIFKAVNYGNTYGKRQFN